MDSGNGRPAKKQKQAYHHYHSLHYKRQDVPDSEPAIPAKETQDKLLVDAVSHVIEETAARQGIDTPKIDSLALQSLTTKAEQCKIQCC